MVQVYKNPSWKDYFRIKEKDGYIRGFYDYLTGDLWISKGDSLHKRMKENSDIPDHACYFVLETDRYSVVRGTERGRLITKRKMRELEPTAKEAERWIPQRLDRCQ